MPKIDNTLRKRIYKRDHYRCALCDCDRYLQVHHYIPRGKGGSNSPHNLITLCSNCHAGVHGVLTAERRENPDYLTAEEHEQLIVEYLADYYAPDWNPWKRE